MWISVDLGRKVGSRFLDTCLGLLGGVPAKTREKLHLVAGHECDHDSYRAEAHFRGGFERQHTVTNHALRLVWMFYCFQTGFDNLSIDFFERQLLLFGVVFHSSIQRV